MPLVNQSYTPPGVYTDEVFNANTAQLSTAARVAVLIGEGPETLTRSNVELHRGSSATADDQVVGENLSDQVGDGTRSFQVTYFPVVNGDGTGTVVANNDVSKIKVVAGGSPVAVASLNGKTGQFTTQSIIPAGTDVSVTYFFKKTDTQILNEDLSNQVPTFASLAIQSSLTLSVSNPGALGNNVTLALTLAASGSGVGDAAAVTGSATDAVSIELRNSDNSVRTYNDIAALVTAGIQTASAGYLTIQSEVSANGNNSASALSAAPFTGGAGQSTNTVFKVKSVPVVDGTNGGVVTTNPSNVQVKVNGVPATVTALDGANGLVTLASPVVANSTVEVTYFTNKYQDTADLLPAGNVAAISQVGYGPNRSDFTEGVDYVLNGNSISWGAAVNTAVGQTTEGFTPFDASVITTTLVDEKVYLRPVTGAVSGRNSVFTLQDVPVDGSGLGIATDNTSLVSVYVGADPVSALSAGAVRVARLSGASAQVTLYNPPAQGSKVYATYYRSTLNDHAFTLSVKNVGAPGAGTFSIADELGNVAPVTAKGSASVTDSNFTNTGIVFPNNASDLAAALGGADETITLTFQNDGLSSVITPAVQASLTVSDGQSHPKLTFTAFSAGTSGNAITITMVGGPTGAADNAAITISGTDITIETVNSDNTTVRTWQQIVDLFQTSNPASSLVTCASVSGADLTSQSTSLSKTNLSGGAEQVTASYANRFLVTTSRTANQAQTDGLGLTGGATTGGSGTGAAGYLGQTYVDAVTGVKFTLVDPKKALSYGFTQLPSPSYQFQPGDTLTFTVSKTAGHVTGATPTNAIPGLQTKVVTTLGMNTGDTAIVSTFNRAGNSPTVGEYYYVTFTTNKTAADFGLQVFSKDTDAYAVYGQPNTANRLALGISLFLKNAGNQQFACIQVPKQAGLTVASDQSFIDAVQSLAAPLQGSGRKANVIQALSSSSTVQQFLSTFLTKQATSRNKGEAVTFVGFDQFASTATIRATAASLANQRVIPVMPNALGVNIQGPLDAAAIEYAVSGEFLAAAAAGLMLSPNNDVATDLVGQNVVGFTRGLVTFDDPTKNLLAVAGITVFNDNNGAMEVRDYRTSDPSNALTLRPYVTTTADFCNQSFRSVLKQFRGRKMTSDLPSTIQGVLNSLVRGWLGNGGSSAIISAVGQISVVPDASDPTTINISVPIRPMFSLLYINLELTVNISQ